MTNSDPEIIDAAMCLWEETLALKERDRRITLAFESQGTSVVRYQIGGMAERCEADYQKARAEGYDDCFDWDFVPDWVAANVVFDEHGATLRS